MSLEADSSVSTTPLYARFSRRVSGLFVDWIITIGVVFGAVAIAIAVRSDNFSRALGFLVIAGLVLYEPVLVSSTGGTLGHHASNLRVVDERGGNLSFLKACARVVIKGALGWYSFLFMAATRRNQAIHDLLTRSTVQIRDPSKAAPNHYITDRLELVAPNMPSRLRRVLVIFAYVAAAFAFLLACLITAVDFSYDCLDNNVCTSIANIMIDVAGLLWLAMVAIIIVLGWKGRLFGARRA
jgi:uncharacterized RDD family membrane protein YckC